MPEAASDFARSVCTLAGASGASGDDTGAGAAPIGVADALWKFNLRPPSGAAATSLTQAPRSNSAVVGVGIAAIIIFVLVAIILALIARWSLKRRASALAHLADSGYGRRGRGGHRRRRRGADQDSADSVSDDDDAAEGAVGAGGSRLSRIDPAVLLGLLRGKVARKASAAAGSKTAKHTDSGSRSSDDEDASGSAGGDEPTSASEDASASASRSEESADDEVQPAPRQSSAARESAVPANFVRKPGEYSHSGKRGARSGKAARNSDALQRLDKLDQQIEKRMSTAQPSAKR